MRKASTELSQSRGLKRRPLLRTSSPLKPKINRGLTFGVVQQTGARHVLIVIRKSESAPSLSRTTPSYCAPSARNAARNF